MLPYPQLARAGTDLHMSNPSSASVGAPSWSAHPTVAIAVLATLEHNITERLKAINPLGLRQRLANT